MKITTMMPAWMDDTQAEEIAMIINSEYAEAQVEAAVEFDTLAEVYDLTIQLPDASTPQFLFDLGEVIGMLYKRVEMDDYVYKSREDASVLN